MHFDEATTVAPLADGQYAAVLPEEYALAGVRPNGGYIVACLHGPRSTQQNKAARPTAT